MKWFWWVHRKSLKRQSLTTHYFATTLVNALYFRIVWLIVSTSVKHGGGEGLRRCSQQQQQQQQQRRLTMLYLLWHDDVIGTYELVLNWRGITTTRSAVLNIVTSLVTAALQSAGNDYYNNDPTISIKCSCIDIYTPHHLLPSFISILHCYYCNAHVIHCSICT